MSKVIAYVNSGETNYSAADLAEWDELMKINIPDIKYIYFSEIQQLFPKLSDPNFQVDIINIDVEFLEKYNNRNPYSLIETLKTLAISTLYRDKTGKTKKRETKIIGTVGYHSSVDTIKEIFPLVDGLCIRLSGDWTYPMLIEDQKRILNGDLSVSKEIKKLLKSKKPKYNFKTADIKLTPRQKQVFTFVTKRGASNKIIAKALNITESTVKLHIGAILKKYGLKNRTQLAVFAKEEN